MATLRGIDVSSYQGTNIKPRLAGMDFVFVKATEGTGYTNPYQQQQATQARNAGCVVGFYHFLQAGNIAKQAAYFVDKAVSTAHDLLVCDWETGASCQQKDQFLHEVKRLRPGHRVGLYCNTSYWKTKDTTSECGDFLWIAAYGVSSPGIQHPWVFWQYTDHPVDTNTTRQALFANRKALADWAAGATPPATTPSATKPPTGGSTSTPTTQGDDDMAITTINTGDSTKTSVTSGKWHTVSIKKSTALANCPTSTSGGRHFDITLSLALTGATNGANIQCRFFRTHGGKRTATYPIGELTATSGGSYPQFTMPGWIAPGDTLSAEVAVMDSKKKTVTLTGAAANGWLAT